MKYPEYPGDGLMFKALSPVEVSEYWAHAEDNDPPKNDSWEIFHPVCRQVWTSRGLCPEDRVSK